MQATTTTMQPRGDEESRGPRARRRLMRAARGRRIMRVMDAPRLAAALAIGLAILLPRAALAQDDVQPAPVDIESDPPTAEETVPPPPNAELDSPTAPAGAAPAPPAQYARPAPAQYAQPAPAYAPQPPPGAMALTQCASDAQCPEQTMCVRRGYCVPYTMGTRPMWSLLIPGIVGLVGAYAVHALSSIFAGLILAAFSVGAATDALWGVVPLAGPWIHLGLHVANSSFGIDDGFTAYLIIDGLVQAAGLTMLIVALTNPVAVRRPERIRPMIRYTGNGLAVQF